MVGHQGWPSLIQHLRGHTGRDDGVSGTDGPLRSPPFPTGRTATRQLIQGEGRAFSLSGLGSRANGLADGRDIP